jgi:hypothetical protein
VRDPRGADTVISMPRALSNHQISRELNLALATVKRQLANVYQRIGVDSRSEAVRLALQEQWIGHSEITQADLDEPALPGRLTGEGASLR